MLAMECMASTNYMRAEVLLTLTNVKYYSACYDKSSDIPCHPPKPSRLEQIIIYYQASPHFSSFCSQPRHDCSTNAFLYYIMLRHKSIYSACQLGKCYLSAKGEPLVALNIPVPPP